VSWNGDHASLTLTDDPTQQVRTRSLSSADAHALVARIAELLEGRPDGRAPREVIARTAPTSAATCHGV
jgi:hypothetical protein